VTYVCELFSVAKLHKTHQIWPRTLELTSRILLLVHEDNFR